jgi:hypothetical protein
LKPELLNQPGKHISPLIKKKKKKPNKQKPETKMGMVAQG